MSKISLVVGLMVVVAGAGHARADGDAAKPMMGVGGGKAPCDMVSAPDGKAKCKAGAPVSVDKLGKASLLTAGAVKTGITFAVGIAGADSHTYLSDSITVQGNDGMAAKDTLVSATPKLRVIAKKFVVLEVQEKFDRVPGQTAKPVHTKWTRAEYLICKPTEGGVNCAHRAFGADGKSCTASMGDDGTLTHACSETEAFGE
ncbi:MAG TPA: hypothetical protein VGM39_25245 [Kofleriaceae bacterium]|jgi:hypothetical protein